jgi:cold shock protein
MGEGTVKSFDASKGYGLITPNDGSRDVFAHSSSTGGSPYRELIEGRKAFYETARDQKRHQSKSVSAL